jgi:hypothetical protein
MQITGQSIYAAAGAYLHLNLLADFSWVSDNLNHPGVGFLTSGYWWAIFKQSSPRGGKNLTQWADSVDPQSPSSVKRVDAMISEIVTGASRDNGSFKARDQYYERALNALHA